MDEDKVELVLNGETLLTSKSYDVSIAFLQVPNQFSLTIGSGNTAIDLMRRYPKGTPFALRINGVVQFMGRTDGFRRAQGNGTELQITGRDALADLVDDDIEHDRSFSNATFEELAQAAFKSAGYEEVTLFYDAAAHRRAVTGSPIIEKTEVPIVVVSEEVGQQGSTLELQMTSAEPVNFDVVTVRQGVTAVATIVQKTIAKVTGFKTEKPIEWKAGTTHYNALNKELARGGIFLRAGVDPGGEDPNIFLLSEPNAAQAPAFGLARILTGNVASNVVSVQPPAIDDLATGRHAKYVVRGRTGGGKDGRQQIEAVFEDAEMKAAGFTKRKVVIDELAKTKRQAEFIARRMCAEARRVNRVFTYTVPNRHTLPLLANPRVRAIPTPDLVVSLRDDEHGMEGLFWIERVRFRASATGTFTDITLMCPEDLVFGSGEFLPAATKAQNVLGKKAVA